MNRWEGGWLPFCCAGYEQGVLQSVPCRVKRKVQPRGHKWPAELELW